MCGFGFASFGIVCVLESIWVCDTGPNLPDYQFYTQNGPEMFNYPTKKWSDSKFITNIYKPENLS